MDAEKQRQHDGAVEADIERLPVDLLAHILSLLSPFRDLSMYVRRHPLISLLFCATSLSPVPALLLCCLAAPTSGRGE